MQQQDKMFDNIKLRHLVAKAQGNLALQVGLNCDNFSPRRAWRDALGPSRDISQRLERPRSLLGSPNITLDSRTQAFLSSAEGMTLVAEVVLRIRSRGDEVAHPVGAANAEFIEPISPSGFSMTTTPGIQALVDLTCTTEDEE